MNTIEEHNLLNMTYDLLANMPIRGVYNMKGDEQEYITNMVDHVDEDKQAIYLISPITGKQYRLQLIADFAPAPTSEV